MSKSCSTGVILLAPRVNSQHSVSIFSLVIKPQKSPGHPNSPWENLARTHCRHALLCNWTDYASKKIVKEILKEEIYNINLWGIIITMYQSVYKIFFPDCEHTVPYHRSCFLSTFFFKERTVFRHFDRKPPLVTYWNY